MLTLGERVANTSPMVVTPPFATASAALTVVTAFAISTRRCSPVAVVTTSESCTATRASPKSAGVDAPVEVATVRFSSAKPIRVTRSSKLPTGTARIAYCPSSPESAPRLVPTTRTCAPGMGCPLCASVTRPAMDAAGAPCAPARPAIDATASAISIPIVLL